MTTKTKSLSISPVGLLSAIAQAEPFLQRNIRWEPSTPFAAKFTDLLQDKALLASIAAIPESELKAIGTSNTEIANKFLAPFGVSLSSPIKTDQFVLLSTILNKYAWNGESESIYTEDEEEGRTRYKAFSVGATGFISPELPYKFFAAKVNETDTVYIVHTGELNAPLSVYESIVNAINTPIETRRGIGYQNFLAPCVKLKGEFNLDWMLNTAGFPEGMRKFTIIEALQHIKAEMDENGGSFEAVTIIRAMFESMKHSYKIESPFLRVYMRDGIQIPLEFSYFAEDSWVKP